MSGISISRGFQHSRRRISDFGICLEMQMIAIEFARHFLGHSDANITEMVPTTTHLIVQMMPNQRNIQKKRVGGTIRRGSDLCKLIPGTKVDETSQSSSVNERHH
jgi:CTP synthase